MRKWLRETWHLYLWYMALGLVAGIAYWLWAREFSDPLARF